MPKRRQGIDSVSQMRNMKHRKISKCYNEVLTVEVDGKTCSDLMGKRLMIRLFLVSCSGGSKSQHNLNQD